MCNTWGRRKFILQSLGYSADLEELYDQSILSNHNIIIGKLYAEGFLGTEKKMEVIYFLQLRVLEFCSFLLQ